MRKVKELSVVVRRGSPGLIQWSPVYSVQIREIDDQHKVLVSLIRHLQEAMEEGRTADVIGPLFDMLRQYTNFHFASEMRLLKQHEYPHADDHGKQHSSLIVQLRKLEEKYKSHHMTAGTPIMQLLRSWLLDHIQTHDKAFSQFLRDRGVR